MTSLPKQPRHLAIETTSLRDWTSAPSFYPCAFTCPLKTGVVVNTQPRAMMNFSVHDFISFPGVFKKIPVTEVVPGQVGPIFLHNDPRRLQFFCKFLIGVERRSKYNIYTFVFNVVFRISDFRLIPQEWLRRLASIEQALGRRCSWR